MCGIVGVYNIQEAANLAYLGLHALQHRGQESAGIVSYDDKTLHQRNGMGLVSDIFDEKVLAQLPGTMAIGHTRYSTSGETIINNSQPFVIRYAKGWMALAHNGNLTNALHHRAEMEAGGSIFQSTMDSEIVMHLLAERLADSLEDRIVSALRKIAGAYSFIFLCGDRMVVARDPHGVRPLVLGKLGNGFVAASETCAFDLIGAQFVREIEPGEVVFFTKQGMTSLWPHAKEKHLAKCVFEYIYFARPDSEIFGETIYNIRRGYGRRLAEEQPVDADVVVPIPDSGVPAAIGYAEQSKIPFQLGLIRNHYVGRTFIEPTSEIRNFGVRLKLNPVREILEGKKVVLIDDSIMRSTTSLKIVKMVRAAGAKEVHLRISAPPTKWPCFYGVDIPTREELVASNMSIEQIRQHIGADSLGYLSQEGLYAFKSGRGGADFCDACFTGNYRIPLIDWPHIEAEAKAERDT